MKEIKVLLVDDDRVDQMAFERFLKEEDLQYDYRIAGSVAEGKEQLKEGVYDIVIIDISLGDGTAFDLFESVGDTPVIVVTGSGDEEIAVRAMKAGAYDYLIKDPDRNYLKVLPVTLKNAIRHKRTEEQFRVFSQALLSTSDTVYITDLKGKIIFANNAFYKAYGYAEKEIIGRDSNILWREDSLKDFKEEDLQKAQHREYYHKRKDGAVFPVTISRSLIKGDSNGNAVAIVMVVHDITGQKEAEKEKERIIEELKKALSEVKQLSGMLPICAGCKKIRDDDGYWHQVECYIRDHSGVEFTHGLCPDCAEKYWPSKTTKGKKK